MNLVRRPNLASGAAADRDFRSFWAAHSVAMVGLQVSYVAVPLIGAKTLHATEFQMGLLAASTTIPFVLFGLFAGVWIDRNRKRPVMIAADVIRAALLMVIPVTAWLDRLDFAILFGVSLLVGTMTVLFDIGATSIVPSLVERRHLVDANSRLESSSSTAQVVGPGLGGMLVGIVGSPFTVMIQASSFLVSALFLRRIHKPESAPEVKAHPPVLSDIREGLGMVLGNTTLRALAGASATTTFFGHVFLSMYVLYMARNLNLSSTEIGLVFSAGGIGALIGAVAAARVTAAFGVGRAMIFGQFMFGFTGLLVPVAILVPSVALPLVIAAEFLQWLFLLIYFVNLTSVRQAMTPHHMLGRVSSSFRVLTWGFQPVGAIVGGITGGLIGSALTLVVGEIGMMIGFLFLLLSPVRHLHGIPHHEDSLPDPVTVGTT